MAMQPIDAAGNIQLPSGEIVDPRTGNWLDQWGVWHNLTGQIFIDGQWIDDPADLPPPSNVIIWWNNRGSTGNTATTTGVNNGGYQATPGTLQDVLNQTNAQDRLLQQERIASAEKIAQLQTQMQLETTRMQVAAQSGNSQLAAETQLKIAQLQNEIQKESNRIALMNAQTAQQAEGRNLMELQARMAANPNDFVAYEFLKRNLSGTPTPVLAGGQTASNGQSTQPGTSGSAAAAGSQLVNPAYNDETIQQIASSLFNAGGSDWNPNLRGTGVFGTQIESPNSIGRGEWMNLSDSERSIIGSLVKGGIDYNGRRVAIDLGDYLGQMQKSWIPTLSSAQVGSQYR